MNVVIVHAVFTILKEECGAAPHLWDDFQYHWPKCVEYRFQGLLGFGGKVWSNNGRIYVSCYREDETMERKAMVDRTNIRLARLQKEASTCPPTPGSTES